MKEAKEITPMIRGGAWDNTEPKLLRDAYLFVFSASYRFDFIGFRCNTTKVTK